MKRSFMILLAVLLILSLSPLALASEPKIVDQADLFSASEQQKLETMAQKLADTYGIDVVIVTVPSLDGKTAKAYADDYFDYNGYGKGPDDSGVLFLISMQERQWHVSTHAAGIDAVTDSDIDYITDQILSDLSAGNYYDAFAAYMELLESEFIEYQDSLTTDLFDVVFNLVIALVIGAVIAGIVLLIMRSKMNTAKQQSGASKYIIDSSYDLFRCQDIFLYSHTSKTRKADSNSGGTHRSSSGRSHGGRGGSF